MNTCKNCLNAYNNPYTPRVLCSIREFEAQFYDVKTYVTPDETCGCFTKRKPDQPRLIFDNAIQLTLF